MFNAALSRVAKLWNWPRCPATNEWIKKKVPYIHNGILFRHKEE
jgi:hypothetical protein